jgi:hypothetical protein
VQCAFFDARDEDAPAIVRTLHAELVSRGWTDGALGDATIGWRIPCHGDERRLVVVMSREDPETWSVEIAPAYRPGLLGALRGKPPSASPADCYEVARIAHEVLQADRRVTALHWGGSEAGVVDELSELSEPPVPPPPPARLVRGR